MIPLFVFDPCFGPWIAYPLLAIVAAGLLIDAALPGPPLRWLRRVLIRLALLLPLAVFLLRPTEIVGEELSTQPTVAVVFDCSRSLDLPAGGGGNGPASGNAAAKMNGRRRDLAEQLHAQTIAPLLAPLPGHHEAWSLNDSLHLLTTPPEKTTVWPACGGGSSLGDGLSDLINGAAPARPGARCDAVIFYTDGAITRGRGWTETLAQLQGSPAPVFVFATGDPRETGPEFFALDRLQGPDRVNAGEEGRFNAILRAPEFWTGTGALRLHWKLDGVEKAVHELPAPQKGAMLADEMTLAFNTPGLVRVTVEVESVPKLPAALPAHVSQLVSVDPKKIRLLFWSMRLSRQTRGLEEQLARDSVLSVNVAGDFFRARGLNVENALRSADVVVWEDPDLARLAAPTREVLETR
ncbi:MAG TPA: hypothetical protein VL860_07360 [Planctomycetota bacterium]|nr:hypothetical protein [Planctomycetota bacterium]